MFFLLNSTRILGFFWDMRYVTFYSPKDAVFAKIMVFSNVFGFPGVNLAQKWNKIVNFGYVLFQVKCKCLKGSSNTVFIFFKTTFGENFGMIKPYLDD